MLSWNEIRHRCIAFSRENRDITSAKSESQTFWNEFFHILGIKRQICTNEHLGLLIRIGVI
jgi:hypothetical protein